MGRNPLFLVRAWSVVSGIFAVVYAVHALLSGKAPAPMPAYLGYLYVGLLAGFVSNALAFQQRRISELEQTLSKRS